MKQKLFHLRLLDIYFACELSSLHLILVGVATQAAEPALKKKLAESLPHAKGPRKGR